MKKSTSKKKTFDPSEVAKKYNDLKIKSPTKTLKKVTKVKSKKK
jgi:hypothetical protein